MNCYKSIIFGCALMAASAASAATINRVSLTNGGGGQAGCGPEPSDSIVSADLIIANLNGGAGHCTFSIDGIAGGGLVGLRGVLNSSKSGVIQSGANSRVTEIYLTPLFDLDDPDEAFNTQFVIGVTMNAGVSGTTTVAVGAVGSQQGSGGADLQGYARLTGFLGGSTFTTDRQTFRSDSAAIGRGEAAGDSSVLSSSLRPSVQHDWRQSLTVEFNMEGDAVVNNFRDPNVTAAFDSFSTLSFSSTGPAFDIPDMFTINAPELNIVNNRWIDPRAAVNPDPTAVPLPAGLPLLIAGLGMLGLLRRKARDL